MPKMLKPTEVKPGRLMSSFSADSVGISNYTIKRDWRRTKDIDMRAEGYEWYRPNTVPGSLDKLLQAIPTNSTEPITLISECVIGNGRIALVAGNTTTLWRYWGLENPAYYDTETFYGNLIQAGSQYAASQYVLNNLIPGNTYSLTLGINDGSILNGTQTITQSGNFQAQGMSVTVNQRVGGAAPVTASINNVTPAPSTYFDVEGGSTYCDEVAQGWIVIASGLNSNGNARRWEAVQVADYLVLNNGVDLPLTYNLQETQAYPIYELREQQIAAVGTIASHAGILCCADIYQITDEAFLDIMAPLPASVKASQDVTGTISPNVGLLFPTLCGTITTAITSGISVPFTPPPTFTVILASTSGITLNSLLTITSGSNYISGVVTNIAGNNVTFTVTGRAGFIIFPTGSPVSILPAGGGNSLIGLTVFWPNGQQSKITGINANGQITSSNTTVIASTSLTIENTAAYGLFDCTQDNYSNFQRYPWRFFPSMPSLPRRFGATVPIAFTASPGYPDQGYGANVGVLLYPVKSIPELINSNQAANGTQVSFTVSGIGTNSGNLTSDIVWTYPEITGSVYLNDPAVTSQPPFNTSTDLGAFIEAADALGSFAGVFEDLQDDDGAIMNMLTLRDQLVIYKETPVVFIASYTGDLSTPFQFQKVPIANASQALKYRNTLIQQGGGYFGSSHLYAGENGFYKFDLFQMTPTELPVLMVCDGAFFSNAQDQENCFAAENPLTQEVFFAFASNTDGSDNALCYDYRYLTARTTSAPLTSAARARNPVDGTYWFVMGMVDGSVQRYGLFDKPTVLSGTISGTLAVTQSAATVTASAAIFTTAHVGMSIEFANGVIAAIEDYVSPTSVNVTLWFLQGSTGFTTPATFKLLPGMWHRDGAAYASIMQSGLDEFGSAISEKQLTQYVMILSSGSPNTPVCVGFTGGINPEEPVQLQSAFIINPKVQNMVSPTLMQFYLGFNVTVNGMNNPIAITEHSLTTIPVDSRSFGRHGGPTCPPTDLTLTPIPFPVSVANGTLSPSVDSSGVVCRWPFWDPVLGQVVYLRINDGQVVIENQ